MTNYRRLISYIYAYEGNTKGKNIGFAKLESRNGQCKLSVNVKKVYVGSSDLEVYLLAPGKEISLGSIFIRGGSGEFRAVVSVENAADSGCGLDQCYGLTIHEQNDTWRAYTTIWEDAVAHAAEVELADVTSGNMGNSEKQIHKKVEELAEEINDGILSSSGCPSLPVTVPLVDSDQEPAAMARTGTANEFAVRKEDGSAGSSVQVSETAAGDGVQVTETAAGDGMQMTESGAGDGVQMAGSGAGDGVQMTGSGAGDGVQMTESGTGDCVQTAESGAGVGVQMAESGAENSVQVTESGAWACVQTAESGAGNSVQVTESGAGNCVQMTESGAGDGRKAEGAAGDDLQITEAAVNGMENEAALAHDGQNEDAMTGNHVYGKNRQYEGKEPSADKTPYPYSRTQTILRSAEAMREDTDPEDINYTEPGNNRFLGGGRPQPVVMPDAAMWQQRERAYRMNRHTRGNMPVSTNTSAGSNIPGSPDRVQRPEAFSRVDTRFQKGAFQRPSTHPGTSTLIQTDNRAGQMEQTGQVEETWQAEQTWQAHRAQPAEQAEPSGQVEPTEQMQPSEQAEPSGQAEPTEQKQPSNQAQPAGDLQPAEQNHPTRQNHPLRQTRWARQNQSTRQAQPSRQNQSPAKMGAAESEETAEEKVLVIDSHKEEMPLGNLQELERLEQEEEENLGPLQLWEGFRKRYPKIQAFESANGCEILTVKPQDIGLLPRENWNYGNNSFLLHGYYNYRYLILARIGDESQGRTRYILGVPGHYYSNEKYMASMFGFPHFVLSKKQPSQDGRFGYWYTDVRMQNQD